MPSVDTGTASAGSKRVVREATGAQEALRQVRSRQEEQAQREAMMRDTQSVLEHGGHPYGVQPLGNMYGGSTASIRPGLGLLMSSLEDQALLALLELLDARQLGLLACCSRAFYVFCHHDELWRALVLHVFGGDFSFALSWKDTFGRCCRKQAYRPHVRRKFPGVYSDLLFQPWLCATLGIRKEWLDRCNIPRRANLSVADFVAEYERPNRPVIVTDVATHWPALRKWSRQYLESAFAEVSFACGPVDMRLRDFFQYADAVQEERPLYLFDKHFASKCPALAEDYSIPPYFATDLFSVLGEQRPDWRWLIIGGARTGSAFHVDPNQTSAWNAVISGRKKWIMWPPHYHPPGVWPSEDGAETTSSASITEWFLNWYPQTQTEAVRPLECVCEAGELLFVPRGWWHCVLNLEPSIAITHNYVSEQNLLNVTEYLRDKPQCISGVPSHRRAALGKDFTDALQRERPGLLRRLEAERASKATVAPGAPSLWEQLVPASDSSQPSTFSFSFG